MGSPEIVDKSWPVVVAHRGASLAYPENTLEAFEGAIAVGADIVELDVRLTSDNVPVVLHDMDVSIATDGSGFVHQLTLAEVRRLDVSKGRGRPAYVPTLREALDLLSGRAGVNVEVKNLPGEPSFDSPREEAAEQVVKMLDEVRFDGPVLVSSFNWLSIERVRDMNPDIPTGFLSVAAIDPRAALVYVISRGHAYVLPQVGALANLAEELVAEAHRAGVRVGTWTVDQPADIEQLFEAGVDAIATNRPEVAVPIRDAKRARGASL